MANTQDTIRTDILINAKAAIASLREMSDLAKNNEVRMKAFAEAALVFSRKNQESLPKVIALFRQLNAELAKQHKKTIFGNTGGVDIIGGAEELLKASKANDMFRTSADGVVTQIRKVNGVMDNAEKATKGWAHKIDLVRTALGTLAAVGVFQVITFISDSFTKATEAAKQLELAVYNLTNAERLISEQGIGLSPQDLTDIIDKLREINPTISRVDATNAVSQIAIFTKGLGLSKEGIEKFTVATAVLAVKNRAAGLSFQQVFDQLKTGALTGTTKGITDLGVNINAGATELEAYRLAGVKTKQDFDALNDTLKEQYRGQAIINIVYEQQVGELETLNSYLETNDAKIESNKAAWEDFLAVVGQGFNNLLPNIVPVLEKLQKSVELGNISKLFGKQRGEDSKGFGWMDTAIWAKLGAGIKLTTKEYERLKSVLSGLSDEEILEIFPDPSAIKDRFTRELVQSVIEVKDTATDASNELENAFSEIDTTKAQEELEDLLKSLEKLGEKIAESERDFQTKLTRFDEDTLEDRARLVEDYNLNVQQTIRSFALRRAELEQKYRQNELDKEAKFQEQLRQLREKFLYNLEDALRERDARQVLRLIDQYNMDKTAMVNEHNLEQELQQQQHQEELNDLKAQEAERLRVMAEEQALRLQRQEEDSALRRTRMLEDHAQEIADMMAQKEEILREAADKIAKEYGLNEEGAKAIYDLLNKYYGGDGILEKLVADGYRGMLGQSAGFLAQLQQIIALQQGLMAQAASYSPYSQGVGGGYIPGSPFAGGGGIGNFQSGDMGGGSIGMASGGQFLATRPTRLTVGEGNKPEIVSVIPLAKLLGGSMGVNGSGGSNGMNGKIEVAVSLSAGLEAEIVNKAMDGVGEVIGKVNRSKL